MVSSPTGQAYTKVKAAQNRLFCGATTVSSRPCFPYASQSGFAGSEAPSDASSISLLADLDPLRPTAGGVWDRLAAGVERRSRGTIEGSNRTGGPELVGS